MVKNMNIETEKKILEAARKIIMHKGKNGARMQEIADEAGVNKALLHYYFRSKEKLYTEVLKGVMDKVLSSVLLKIDPHASTKEFLRQFIANHIHFIRDNREVIRFFLGEISTNHQQVAAVMKKQFLLMDQPAHQLIAGKIRQSIKNNEIKPIEPVSLMVNVLSLDIFFFVISPIVHIVLETPEKRQQELIANRADHVFEFVWKAIKKE